MTSFRIFGTQFKFSDFKPSGKIGIYFYTFLVLLLGILFTLLAYLLTRQLDQRALKMEFDHLSHESMERIKSRLDAYHQVLLGVRGLFISSTEVNRNEFRVYIAGLGLADAYPGIQGVGFSKIVKPDELVDHIQKVRT
ncbi:MAG: CHASE domain-containing protein, partial [Spirochaetia bacterium]|nr:CHASE domain-containing protein [Spirochaetia bacterium]